MRFNAINVSFSPTDCSTPLRQTRVAAWRKQTALVLGACSCAFIATHAALADITLPSLITENAVFQRDVTMPIWGTALPGEKISVTFDSAKAEGVADAQGKWSVALPAHSAGGPYVLVVRDNGSVVSVPNILVGDVWLCSGQSNMEFALRRDKNVAEASAASADPDLRFFRVSQAQRPAPVEVVKATWNESSPASSPGFSAVGYYFGRALRKAENVPIGLIGSYVGGTPAQAWTREEVLGSDPELKKRYVDPYPVALAEHDRAMAKYKAAADKAKETGAKAPVKPYSFWSNSGLYNGMIAPLTRFPIRGVIWYQGETNAHDPIGYRTLLPALIQDWRMQWAEPQMPFLIVQLASFGTKEGDGLAWAELREAQANTAETIPGTALVVTTDVGTEHDIHPTDKAPVGERLSLAARRLVYGEKNLVASGPTYKTISIDGNKILVTFDHVGAGLVIKGGECSGQPVPDNKLVGFTIAGGDANFVPAEAKIVGADTVEVSAPTVADPKSVRFGFVNFPIVNLWNKDGLPASPFRTDR